MDKVIKEGTLRLQSTESTCDIILCCNGQRLMAHKLILSIASPVFREILQKDPDSTIVILPEIDSTAMTLILDYIYTGTTVVLSKNIEDFVSLAKFFNIELDNKYIERFLEEKKEILNDIEVKKQEEEVEFTKDLVNNNVILDNTDIFKKNGKELLKVDKKDELQEALHSTRAPKSKTVHNFNELPKNNKILDFSTRTKQSCTKTPKQLPNLLPLTNFSKTTQPIKNKSSSLPIPTIPSPWCPSFGENFMEDPRRVYLRNPENEIPTAFPKNQPQEDNNNNCPTFTSYPHQTTSRYVPSKLNNVIRSLYLSNYSSDTTKDISKTSDVQNCVRSLYLSNHSADTTKDISKTSEVQNCVRSLYLSNYSSDTTKDISKTGDVQNCVVTTSMKPNFGFNEKIRETFESTGENCGRFTKDKCSSEKNNLGTKKTRKKVLKGLLSTKNIEKYTLNESKSTTINHLFGSDNKFLKNSENLEVSTLNKTVFDTNDYPINLTQNFTRFQEDKIPLVSKRTIKPDTVKNCALSDHLDCSSDSGQDSDSLKLTIHNNNVLEDTKELESDEIGCKKGDEGRAETIRKKRKSVEGNEVKYGKKKAFECVDCKKCFSQLRNYKYHRSLHEGTKEFSAKCLECGKTFNDKGYLSSHMKIHRDKKEYACPSCPKRFNQRVAYNMHLRIHTGLKPHHCPTCGKSFSRKMLLKQHQRVHTGERPYSCPECGKSFADRSNMSLHTRLHTGVKPYACDLCPKSFTKKHHLKTHMNLHTGLKPYSCENCDLAFSQSSNMRTHYKKCILRKEETVV